MARLPPRFAAVILTFALVPSTQLAARRGAADRCHSGPGPAYGDQRPAGHRPGARAAVRGLPTRAEPRGIMPTGRCAPAARLAARCLRAVRAGRAGDRRHNRAQAWQAHRGQGCLPGSRAVPASALRQGTWPALAQPDAVGAGSMGAAGAGPAAPDGAGPLGVLLPNARAAAQEADRLGTATRAASPPLAARPRIGRRGRQCLAALGWRGAQLAGTREKVSWILAGLYR